MGYSWDSHAEVVTTQPEKVAKLILQIANEGDTSPVCNLKIQGNSISFDSDGYGCYGVEYECYKDDLLFERLCEECTEALICYESVSPCLGVRHDFSYYFISLWAKPESGDDDENETHYEYSHAICYENLDISKSHNFELRPPGFNKGELWNIAIDNKDYLKKNLPNLYATIKKAKAKRFEDWAENWDYLDGKKVITYEIAQKIGQLYYGDDMAMQEAIEEECFEDIGRWNASSLGYMTESINFNLPDELSTYLSQF